MSKRKLEGLIVTILAGGLGTLVPALEQALHDGGSPDWVKLSLGFSVGALTGVLAWLRTPPTKEE